MENLLKLTEVKSIFKLIIFLIFRKRQLKRIFEENLDRVINEKILPIKKDFEKKMEFLIENDLNKGISNKQDFVNPIIEIPIFERDRISFSVNPCEQTGNLEIKHLKLNPYFISFASERLSVDKFKNIAALELSKQLINEGFLTYQIKNDYQSFRESTIIFSINTFQAIN